MQPSDETAPTKSEEGDKQSLYNRRQFFALLGDLKRDSVPSRRHERKESAPQQQQFVEGELSDLPESVFRRTVPVLREDLLVTVRDGALAYHNEQGEEGRIPLRPPACDAARMFDGRRTLEQVGTSLDAGAADGAPKEGFSAAREAFLALAAHGVYYPAGAPRQMLYRRVAGDDEKEPENDSSGTRLCGRQSRNTGETKHDGRTA